MAYDLAKSTMNLQVFKFTLFTINPGQILQHDISITNVTFKLLQDIELTLPDGVETTDLKWFSVWCRRFSANFGDLFFPEGFALEGEKPVEATSKVIPVCHVTISKSL